MKRFPLFILVFLLAACAAPATSTPTAISASATASREATVTLSPSPTQPSPTAKATVDPLAWQSFGPNSEIIATGAGLTLWDDTPQEQRFTINQENAEKLHEGLFTFAAMANWHGNEMIRSQFANFMAYEQYLKDHPEQEGAIIFGSNYRAGDPNSRNEGKFVEVSGKVDYSQFAVAFDDTDDTPEGEGWIHAFGGVVFKMQVVQNPDGDNIIQFAFSNKLQFDDTTYGLLGLNQEKSNVENVMVLTQVLNYAINEAGKIANRDHYSTVGINKDGSWFLNFGSGPALTKSYMEAMANGTEYVEVAGDEITDVSWGARVELYNLSNWWAYALMAENSRSG